MKNFIVMAAIMLLADIFGYGQQTRFGDDIRKVIHDYGQAEVRIVYPGFEPMTLLASRYSVSDCDAENAVLVLSPLTAEEFISEAIPYTLLLPVTAKGFYTASTAAEAMKWKSYPTLPQYDTILSTIAKRYPSVCLIDTIGYSVMGRVIVALKISDNPYEDENEPEVLLSGGIHGNELAGFVILLRLAEHLASESSKGGLPAKLTSELEVWITPLANPDGMYRNSDVITSPIRFNSNGYDLNRNFPDPEVVPGPPLQPETVAMINFISKHKFVLSASLHSGKEVVDYPWDKWIRPHADNEWFKEICRRYADTVHLRAEKGYMIDGDNGVLRGSTLFIMRGGRQDFITYGYGGRELTIEIDDTDLTPGPSLDLLWNWNKRSLLRFLEESLYGLQGTITDAETGLHPVTKIFIDKHDVDSSHVYSDPLTGEYCRFLPTGVWTFTFTSKGYNSYDAENLRINYDMLTSLNVQLVPLGTNINHTPHDSGLVVYPNPATGEWVMIRLPANLCGDINVTVTGISGEVFDVFKTNATPGIPLIIGCNNLPSGLYIVSVNKSPAGPRAYFKVIIN